MATTNEQLAVLYARLLTNYTELEKNFYDIFINPEPMDITLNLSDKEGETESITIPNRAKDKTHILNGEGSPEGTVTGVLGDLYQDLENGEVYLKKGDTETADGWSLILSKEDLDKIIIEGIGNPNGVVSATKGTLYADRAEAIVYIKKTIGGTDGWVNIVAVSLKEGKGITIDADNTINAPNYRLNSGAGIVVEDKILSNTTLTAEVEIDNDNVTGYCNNPSGFSFDEDGIYVKTAKLYSEKSVDNSKVNTGLNTRGSNISTFYILNGKIVKYNTWDGTIDLAFTPPDLSSSLYNTTYMEGDPWGDSQLACVINGYLGYYGRNNVAHFNSNNVFNEALTYAGGTLNLPPSTGNVGFPFLARTVSGKLYYGYARTSTGTTELDIDVNSITQIGDTEGGYGQPVASNGFDHWYIIKNGNLYHFKEDTLYQEATDITGTWTQIVSGVGAYYGLCSGKLYYFEHQYYSSPTSITQVGTATNWQILSGCHTNATYSGNNMDYAYAINSNGDLYRLQETNAELVNESGWTDVLGTWISSGEHCAFGIKGGNLYKLNGLTIELVSDEGTWSNLSGRCSWGNFAFARCTKDGKTITYKLNFTSGNEHVSPCYLAYYTSDDFYANNTVPITNHADTLEYNYGVHIDNIWDISEDGDDLTVTYTKTSNSEWVTDIRVKNYYESGKIGYVYNQRQLAESVYTNPSGVQSNLLHKRWCPGTWTVQFPYGQTYEASECTGFYMPVKEHLNGMRKLVIDGNFCTFKPDFSQLTMSENMFTFDAIDNDIEIEIKNMTIEGVGDSVAKTKTGILISNYNTSIGSHAKFVFDNCTFSGMKYAVSVCCPTAEVKFNNCTFSRGNLPNDTQFIAINTQDNVQSLNTVQCTFTNCNECIITDANVTKSLNDTFTNCDYGITQEGVGLLMIEEPTFTNVTVPYSTETVYNNGVFIKE